MNGRDLMKQCSNSIRRDIVLSSQNECLQSLARTDVEVKHDLICKVLKRHKFQIGQIANSVGSNGGLLLINVGQSEPSQTRRVCNQFHNQVPYKGKKSNQTRFVCLFPFYLDIEAQRD